MGDFFVEEFADLRKLNEASVERIHFENHSFELLKCEDSLVFVYEFHV